MNTRKKKMIILGLDNAGKSTIVLTLKKQLKLKDIAKLQPTKGVITEQFEGEDALYQVWDFGGQENYRNSYLQRPEYFAATDICIFVIDIQDQPRYAQALNYLKRILEIMKQLGEYCEFSIFLHKFDPELQDTEEYDIRSREVIKKIRELFINYNFPLKIYHTSIYFYFQRIRII
ncbi:MAG: ADP-ribosylation factor-like protein [Candidatus Helarchaeota archaeon]